MNICSQSQPSFAALLIASLNANFFKPMEYVGNLTGNSVINFITNTTAVRIGDIFHHVKIIGKILETVGKIAGAKIRIKQGEKGEQGIQGKQGPQGKLGPQGEKGLNGLDGKDGKDGADGKSIVGPAGKDGSPDSKEQVRDKLEELKDGEKLSIQAIQDLSKILEELRKVERGGKGGGGFSKIHMDRHFIDDETPTGTINGVTTAFTISKAPNPVGSLKVYLNGQRMRVTEDYTFSGRTITFTTAPPTSSILLVDFRY